MGTRLIAVFFVLFLAAAMPSKLLAIEAKMVSSPYFYNFNSAGTLIESGSDITSSSAYWWLNSGAKMIIKDGHGMTVQGELLATDPWRVLYNKNNPTDTDNGYHPQNIFRLLTRSKWQNMRQEAFFKINKDNLSSSSNRNASNGLLFFNRYLNSQSLYYTGVRVDGSAVIKKKLNGTYYTLAQVKGIYPGTYDRNSSPDLLPKNKWIGLRSEVTNESGGKVRIKLYLDKGWTGSWQLVAEAVDDGAKYGKAITDSGYAGVRTDFVDAEFENYRLQNI